MKPATQTERGVEVRAGYKRTEVGVIPEDWEVCPVRGKGEVLTGKALAVNALGPQRPYLRTKNVFDGRIDIDDVLTMPMTDEQFAQFQIRNGDVLLNEGQSLELVGRCAIYQDEYPEPCAIQNALLRFRAREDVSKKFASYLFRHCQQTGVFARIALQTTSVAHLGGSRFERLCLPWPTEPEQRAIAAALSDVDALLGGLDRLIAKKRDLKQAAMQQLLTGQTRLPGFSGEWEVKRLGDVGATYGGLTGKTKADFGEGAASYITFMNVMSNLVIDCDMFERVNVSPHETQNLVMKGDLFFNGSSETPEEVAMCAVLLEDVRDIYLNSFCFGFRFREGAQADGVFFAYYLRSEEGRELMKSLAQGSTRYNLSKVALLDSSLLSPSLPEQSAIAAVLSDMDAELSKLVARRDKTRNLKQAMMQELLTGRIRLV
jgi:type I restriction enzyme S subunit